MIYILALLISVCLISGQTLWASVVKNKISQGPVSNTELLSYLITNPKIWLGAFFYVAGTIFYFLLLSKVKFFSIQMTMTGLAIIFSVGVSYFVLKEQVTISNLLGIVLILVGIGLVFGR